MIEFENAVFDTNFLKQQSGRVLDYSRTKAWMKLSNDSYKNKMEKIQDINMLVFGGERHNVKDIMEADLTYDRFMELQEHNVDEDLDTGFALIMDKYQLQQIKMILQKSSYKKIQTKKYGISVQYNGRICCKKRTNQSQRR